MFTGNVASFLVINSYYLPKHIRRWKYQNAGGKKKVEVTGNMELDSARSAFHSWPCYLLAVFKLLNLSKL